MTLATVRNKKNRAQANKEKRTSIASASMLMMSGFRIAGIYEKNAAFASSLKRKEHMK